MTALDAAHTDLAARIAAADRAGDWQERSVLEPLATVADHLRRVADHPDSAHYRADKTGALVAGAIKAQEEAFWAYAGWPDDDTEPAHLIAAATKVLQQVTWAARVVLWQAAQAALDGTDPAVFTEQAAELQAAARAVAAWADMVAARAVPDPDRKAGR